jgi:hypothetical protein
MAAAFQSGDREDVATSKDSSTSGKDAPQSPRRIGWLRVAAIAAASALAGGLAAAWWHRNTLAKLRHNQETPPNPDFGMSDSESPEEP